MTWHQCGFVLRWNGGCLMEVFEKTTLKEKGSFTVGPGWRDARLDEVEAAVDAYCDTFRAELKRKHLSIGLTRHLPPKSGEAAGIVVDSLTF